MGLYFFGQQIALNSILKGNFIIGFKRLIYPIGYWRYPVFIRLIDFIEKEKSLKILDIGSPKVLGLYLSLKKNHQVFATDINDEKIFTMWERYYRDHCNINKIKKINNYITEYQDARKLNYNDSMFDLVFSISVVEHIPDNGDSIAMTEIARVLKPNGIAIIEVPFALTHYYSYKKNDIYERKYEGKPIFYQRHYDDHTLFSRLINPSGMELLDKVIIGEKLPFERLYDSLPGIIRMPMHPFEAVISIFNHVEISAYRLANDKKMGKNRAMDATIYLKKAVR